MRTPGLTNPSACGDRNDKRRNELRCQRPIIYHRRSWDRRTWPPVGIACGAGTSRRFEVPDLADNSQDLASDGCFHGPRWPASGGAGQQSWGSQDPGPHRGTLNQHGQDVNPLGSRQPGGDGQQRVIAPRTSVAVVAGSLLGQSVGLADRRIKVDGEWCVAGFGTSLPDPGQQLAAHPVQLADMAPPEAAQEGSQSGGSLSPNPPKDTDGRREDSGRGWVRELQGRWPGVLG